MKKITYHQAQQFVKQLALLRDSFDFISPEEKDVFRRVEQYAQHFIKEGDLKNKYPYKNEKGWSKKDSLKLLTWTGVEDFGKLHPFELKELRDIRLLQDRGGKRRELFNGTLEEINNFLSVNNFPYRVSISSFSGKVDIQKV